MYRAAIVIVIIGLALFVPAASAKTDYVIVRDESVGGFPRTGTVREAIQVFGTPTTRENQQYDECKLSWRAHGVVMQTYYTNGALDPCGPEGQHKSSTVSDRRWRTSKGLEIGEALSELRKLYPRAQKETPGRWRLTTRPFAGLPYPGLAASVKNGRVLSFTVYGPRSPF